MATTASPLIQAVELGSGATRRGARKRKSLLALVFDALVTARQKEAERIVASVVARQGGRFTDGLERRIEKHVF
jgi:hypothetical protein